MKRLVLASASPQRRALMKILGLPFVVKPSAAQEITTLKGSVAGLVKHNALLKARAVAALEKSALVIGCDTVVYWGTGV